MNSKTTFFRRWIPDFEAVSSHVAGPRKTPEARSIKIAGIHKLNSKQSQKSMFFDVIATDQNNSKVVSSDPPIVSLNGGTHIPTTTFAVDGHWESLEIDEILLARLRELKAADVFEDIDNTIPKYILAHSWEGILRIREPNITDMLMVYTGSTDRLDSHLSALFGTVMSGFIYGGMHALAWSSTPFRTFTEQLLWKISCITILSSGVFLVFTYIFYEDVLPRQLLQLQAEGKLNEKVVDILG